MDTICIDGLELACIVGVRPRERRRKQTVRINLSLGLDLSRAGHSGRITQTCDYAQIADELTALLQFREYQLIEVATEEVSAMLFGVHPVVERVEIELEKPAALRGRARSASVRIERRHSDFPRRREPTTYGEREVLLETHEAGLYLFGIDSGKTLHIDTSRSARRLEWLVSGELMRGPHALRDAEPRTVQKRTEPVINSSDRRATLFSCTTPRLEQHTSERHPKSSAS